MSEYKANETPACCCVDVGTVIDGEDCHVEFAQVYETEQAAQEALSYLTEKAQKAESDPCKIEHTFRTVPEGIELKANFEFSCQAEAMIFQLSTR